MKISTVLNCWWFVPGRLEMSVLLGVSFRWKESQSPSITEQSPRTPTSMPAVMLQFFRVPLKVKVRVCVGAHSCSLKDALLFVWLGCCEMFFTLSSECFKESKMQVVAHRSGRGCDCFGPGEEKQWAEAEDQSSLWSILWWGESFIHSFHMKWSQVQIQQQVTNINQKLMSWKCWNISCQPSLWPHHVKCSEHLQICNTNQVDGCDSEVKSAFRLKLLIANQFLSHESTGLKDWI